SPLQSPPQMKRFVLLAVAGLAGTSHAQGMTGTIGSGSLSIGNKLWLHKDNSTDLGLPSDPISQSQYFNMAACPCSRPNFPTITPWNEFSYSLEIDVTPDVSTVHRPLQIWVGTGC